MNSLGTESTADLQQAFLKCQADPSAKSAALISGKPCCFIAGADINMLKGCQTKEEATQLSKECQDFLFQVRSLDYVEQRLTYVLILG